MARAVSDTFGIVNIYEEQMRSPLDHWQRPKMHPHPICMKRIRYNLNFVCLATSLRFLSSHYAYQSTPKTWYSVTGAVGYHSAESV